MIRTFQSQSERPPAPPAFLASAAPGAATAARTAVVNIQDKARLGLRSAKSAIGRADILIFFPILAAAKAREPMRRIKGFHGSSLPIWLGSAISANFIARLIKGCRVDARAGCSVFRNSRALSTL